MQRKSNKAASGNSAIAVALCALAMGCDVRISTGVSSPITNDHAMAESTKTHLYQVQWGYRGDSLAYVCFVGSRFPVDSVTGIVAASGRRGEYFVHRPDGSKVAIPGKHQLFELIDGRYRESTQKVSSAEFEAFTASRRAEYSIDALVRFAESLRRNTK